MAKKTKNAASDTIAAHPAPPVQATRPAAKRDQEAATRPAVESSDAPAPAKPRTASAKRKDRDAHAKLNRSKSVTGAKASMSGLDAAHAVLTASKSPLTVGALTKAMLDRKLWTTEGKTPHATIAAAILREMRDKGSASRFTKVGRGLFAARASKSTGGAGETPAQAAAPRRRGRDAAGDGKSRR